MKYSVNRHAAKNPGQYSDGVKINPAPSLMDVLHIQDTFHGDRYYRVTDCAYEDSYAVVWMPQRANDRLIELIEQELEAIA